MTNPGNSHAPAMSSADFETVALALQNRLPASVTNSAFNKLLLATVASQRMAAKGVTSLTEKDLMELDKQLSASAVNYVTEATDQMEDSKPAMHHYLASSQNSIEAGSQDHGMANAQQSPRLANSQSPRLANSQSPRLANSQSPRMTNSQSPRLANSQSPGLGHSPGPRVAHSGSARAPTSQSDSVTTSPPRAGSNRSGPATSVSQRGVSSRKPAPRLLSVTSHHRPLAVSDPSVSNSSSSGANYSHCDPVSSVADSGYHGNAPGSSTSPAGLSSPVGVLHKEAASSSLGYRVPMVSYARHSPPVSSPVMTRMSDMHVSQHKISSSSSSLSSPVLSKVPPSLSQVHSAELDGVPSSVYERISSSESSQELQSSRIEGTDSLYTGTGGRTVTGGDITTPC